MFTLLIIHLFFLYAQYYAAAFLEEISKCNCPYAGCASWYHARSWDNIDGIASVCQISLTELRQLNWGLMYTNPKQVITGQRFCCRTNWPITTTGKIYCTIILKRIIKIYSSVLFTEPYPPYPGCRAWTVIRQNRKCNDIAKTCKTTPEQLKALNFGSLIAWQTSGSGPCGHLIPGQLVCCRK